MPPTTSKGQRYAPVSGAVPDEDTPYDSADEGTLSGLSDIDDPNEVKLRRVDRSARGPRNASAAYAPTSARRKSGDVEAYLDSITDAEQELLSASRQYDLVDDELASDDEELKRGRRERQRRRSLIQAQSGGWRAVRHARYWWRTLVAVIVGLALLVWAFSSFAARRDKNRPVGMPPSDSWFPSPRGGTLDAWADDYRKAQELVQRMSLVEKINITTGIGWSMGMCVGNTGTAESVGFPSLCLQDGPLGIRFTDRITPFPAGITTGATWNRDLMRARGAAMGAEARIKGINVLLGPSMGPLGMMPAGGRNWESFGSDPVLAGVAAAETIRGIQSNGVMATAKHFVMNEQEHFRRPYEWGISHAVSSNIGERALREVFVWPFAESVRADVASVMCAYQQVNNSHTCENSKLLNGILKDELGFQGFVQSDWGAQRSGINSALGGLDMSMPGDGLRWADGKPLWGPELTRAALNTSVPMERINDMVTRIVAAWYHLKQDEWEPGQGPNFSSWTNDAEGYIHHGSPGTPETKETGVVNFYFEARGEGELAHAITARRVAAEGIVLVKNTDQTLPLARGPPTPEAGLRVGVYGDDSGPGMGPNGCPDRGCNQGTLGMGWGSGTVDYPYLVSPLEALEQAWAPGVDMTAYTRNMVMPQDATDKDLCLVFVSADSGEGYISAHGIHGDRNHLFLQKGGDTLINTVAENCGEGAGRTVVVVHAVGPVVVEPWIDLPGVHAVLFAHLPGQESGTALMDVLFGDVDASGRLPYTVGKSLEDYGPGAQVLYEPNAPVPQVDFDQGLYIDHRYFDQYNVTPRYEFGYGLSYTSFSLSDLKITPLRSRSVLPPARVADPRAAPEYERQPPLGEGVLFPEGFSPVPKYIYPYLTSLEGTSPAPYQHYPKNYTVIPPRRGSPSGGGLGGNPTLYDLMATVEVQVTNTGPRTGQTVIQAYVSFPSGVTEEVWVETEEGSGEQELVTLPVDFPVRVLRNFSKVEVAPGAQQTVSMTLTRKDLSYWSKAQQNWVLPAGAFEIRVGTSSRDLPLGGTL
ncbi:putative glycosyl hydrolase [Aspergillus campestris IBT 28561]|uniref:Probable beta-glucosidase E n=1 Tax=Aspergillus campestris (strain IBT 28561) TaxID=1392248 RepID=A0A2I1DA33_ASPC2|nr:putative glycosyl hydrolase [Aspergillus campestris IBT 28561]PKY06735.1 putative glycosyl hydrolase [Aspergillus campestris IBT 28561]